MKSFLIIFVLIFLLVANLYSSPIDTGMKQWEQPNGVTFNAHLKGDEFSIQFTTDTGYEIREGSDNWYYYAILDENDNIVPSDKKVGIDTPPTESYNLQIPFSKQQEIEQLRAQFYLELQEAADWFQQKRDEAIGGTVTMKIGVILVDFADSVHWKKSDPPHAYPNGYPESYFDSLLFSQDDWYDPEGQNDIHPEDQGVFGSLRDYYNQQSRSKLDITGKDGLPEILNPEDPLHPGVPDWVYLDEEKSVWAQYSLNDPLSPDLLAASKIKFQEKFQNINLLEYDRIVAIYAGSRGPAGSVLHPHATPNKGYIMSERTYTAFSHIGVHSHEFAHLLGAFDEYEGIVNPSFWSLMSYGDRNGPNINESCPAGFSPYYRIFWDWVNVTYLNRPNYTNYVFNYNYDNPNYYRIDVPHDPTEYFILENRLREGFDLWTPNDPSLPPVNPGDDPNGNQGGLMIWHIDEDNFVNYDSDIVFYKSAGRFYNSMEDPFPFIWDDEFNSGEN